MVFPKKILTIALILLVAGSVAAFLILKKKPASNGQESRGSDAPAAAKAEEVPLPVKVVPAIKGDLIIRLKSPGEAFVEKRSVLKAEVRGGLKELRVEEGLHVRKGDLLVELDDQEYRLNLEAREAARLRTLSEILLENQFSPAAQALSPEAEAKIRKTREDFAKTDGLFQQGMVSRNDYEKARKDFEMVMIESGLRKEEIQAASKGLTQAEVDLKIARMELDKTKLRAPFDGIITGIKVSPGERIEAGREILTLVNISEVKVLAKVLESEVGKMKVGQEVDLRFSAYPGRTFKGQVKAVSPVINPEDRTCSVHVTVDNPREEIKPGMHAEVEIAAEVYPGRLLVPQEAVLVRGGRRLVFVVEEGLAKWRYVEVGLGNEEYAEILDGVMEGEPVVVEGHFTLAHDARVRVAD